MNNEVQAWNFPGKIHKNETPRTRFKDEILAVRVKMVSSPTKEKLYRTFKNVALVSFGESWKEHSFDDCVGFLSSVLDKKMLPLALEMNNFTFLITGLTRISTHALVRSRVGVTYAQESTGNSDQRHCDILVPRSMSIQNSVLLKCYIDWALESKMKYVKAVDSGMSVQESRVFLPSTNSNKIYVSFNLASLVSFYSKRTDRTEEYMQLNEVCRQIKQIFDKHYSELSPILKSSCGVSCAHVKNSPLVNGVYRPSKEDDVFEWNDKSFIYNKTRDEMCWNEVPVKSSYYFGKTKVSKRTFLRTERGR